MYSKQHFRFYVNVISFEIPYQLAKNNIKTMLFKQYPNCVINRKKNYSLIGNTLYNSEYINKKYAN